MLLFSNKEKVQVSNYEELFSDRKTVVPELYGNTHCILIIPYAEPSCCVRDFCRNIIWQSKKVCSVDTSDFGFNIVVSVKKKDARFFSETVLFKTEIRHIS